MCTNDAHTRNERSWDCQKRDLGTMNDANVAYPLAFVVVDREPDLSPCRCPRLHVSQGQAVLCGTTTTQDVLDGQELVFVVVAGGAKVLVALVGDVERRKARRGRAGPGRAGRTNLIFMEKKP